MATRDTDLTSLRIDRSAPTGGSSRKFRALRKIVGWLVVITLIGGGVLLLKDYFNPGLEVQLVTASLTSPALANAVLTASGYVVARRKAAVASKGTGTLVYLGVEEGDRWKKGQVVAAREAGGGRRCGGAVPSGPRLTRLRQLRRKRSRGRGRQHAHPRAVRRHRAQEER